MYEIHFLGACGTVTGSRYLLRVWNKNILIDCGLFQGDQETKQLNWKAFPFPPEKIHGVILTHAHIDHSGYLPRLRKLGFEGPVWCTPGTAALLQIMLPDAGELQEEEARFAEKKGYSPFRPALPLFTEADARRILQQVEAVPFDAPREIIPGLSFTYHHAGHILGAASLELRLRRKGGKHHTWVFSGDVGRPGHPILQPAAPAPPCDFLVLESTYGDRLHPREDVHALLEAVVKRTASRGGVLLIPAFAVDRTQELLVILADLIQEGRLPKNLPVYIDSPMALDALNFYKQFHAEYNDAFAARARRSPHPLALPNFHPVRQVEGSKALNDLREPAVILSASGMCNGGRIEHHLKFKLPDPRNTILFVGFQAQGTKGRRIVDGEPEVMMHGEMVPVKAEVAVVSGLSAHADREELLDWAEPQPVMPDVFIVHGEDPSRAGLASRLKERLDWTSLTPKAGEIVRL